MAKPIILVALNSSFDQKSLCEIQKLLENKIGEDYYSLVYINNKIDEIEFKALYEKDFDDIKFEELKQLILSEFK